MAQGFDPTKSVLETYWFKGMLAFAASLGSFFIFLREVRDRNISSSTKAEEFGIQNTSYQYIIRWPHRIYFYTALAGSTVLLVIALGYFATLVFGEPGADTFPGMFLGVAEFLTWPSVALTILVYFLFWTHLLEHLGLFAMRVLAPSKRGFGWINAKWELQAEGYRRVLAPSEDRVDELAAELADQLVNGQKNPRMALRPNGLSDDVAANVLFFGHVVEDYCERVPGTTFEWTDFYVALGRVATEPDSPFSPSALGNNSNNAHQTLLRANRYLANPTIPNSGGLEQQVTKAARILNREFNNDARKIARSLFGASYFSAHRKSKRFLESDGMRRQFAKLFIIWNVSPRTRRPDAFKIPFSANIFRMYLDRLALRAEGDEFRAQDERVRLAMERIQQSVMQKASNQIQESTDPVRMSWIATEKRFAEDRGLDWRWWLLYRTDQHLYYMGKNHPQRSWGIEGDMIVRS